MGPLSGGTLILTQKSTVQSHKMDVNRVHLSLVSHKFSPNSGNGPRDYDLCKGTMHHLYDLYKYQI